VALARNGFERVKIEYLDDPPAIADCSTGLNFDRHFGYGRSSNAKHLRKKFLREQDGIAFGAVAGLQEPSAEPLFNSVEGITSGADPGLLQKRLIVSNAQI
jgi:hypothetical protein